MITRSDIAADYGDSERSRLNVSGVSIAGRDGDRRGPGRPQGDGKLPAHIMAAIRQTIYAAAATCVDASRLEASGPYEWLAIVESRDDELYQLLRRFIESCRYLDELQHHGIDLGPTRLAEAVRNATFARESMRASLEDAVVRKKG